MLATFASVDYKIQYEQSARQSLSMHRLGIFDGKKGGVFSVLAQSLDEGVFVFLVLLLEQSVFYQLFLSKMT